MNRAQDPSRRAQTAPAAAPTSPQRSRGERFRLAVLVCAGRLWVEDLGEEALATDQLSLVAAMGRALTHPELDAASPRSAQFVWPLHDNQQLDLGAEEAAASLGGFLRRQLDENACVELVCMGEAAAKRLHSLPLPCAKRIVASTREVLSKPNLKAALWRELRA